MSYAERTKRPPRTLTDAEVKKILKVTGEAKAGFRDHMIISLALGCGLRESEIVALTVDDVAKADGKTPKRIIQLKVFKRAALDANPNDHRVHVPDATYYKLAKYLASIEASKLYRDTLIFTSRNGTSWTKGICTRQIRRMFRGWQERAGFDQIYNFHCLRHTAITGVRRKTGDIRLAQRFARHASIATTVRYDHVSDEELAAAVKGITA
jgi:integrase/recombinase XerC